VIRAFVYALLAVQAGSALGAEPRQKQSESAQFVGAAGCKSSSCHGGAGEKRSQFITWMKQDFHTRGFAILTNARSERIAEALNLPPTQIGSNAAQTSARCTVCHSPFQAVPVTQRPPNVDPNESISCESCHGAAGTWLRGHTRPDWTYATRVGAGMRDLKSLYVRANTCVACHQNLDADITAAGHPALVFELDSQSVNQPKHWRDAEGSGVRAWLTGQAVALREVSWHLSMNSNPQALAEWRALVWLLSRVTASEGTLLPIDAGAAQAAPDFGRTRQQADALARRAAAQQNLGAEFANRLTRTLTDLDGQFVENAEMPRQVLFLRAQRLVLALERLSDAANGTPPGAPRVAELAELRQDLRFAGEFEPARFAERVERYRASLASATR
jgi:hypothetical protein